MSHIYSHQQTTSTTPAVITVATLADARKLANKERRNAGRERHEEHKQELKTHEFDRKRERRDRDRVRQERRLEDGTRAFTGRNLYNHRKACASHVRGATDTIPTTTSAIEDGDHHHLEDEEAAAYYDTEEEEEAVVVRFTEQQQQQQATSGASLLAMARPAKIRARQHHRPPVMTDGERFEVVEIDGRLVALDEDGWEILPDENDEVSLLYSDIVRGTAL